MTVCYFKIERIVNFGEYYKSVNLKKDEISKEKINKFSKELSETEKL
jgi:hypothetical protein